MSSNHRLTRPSVRGGQAADSFIPAEGGKFRPGESPVEPDLFPAEVIRHLLAGRGSFFSDESVSLVSKRLASLIAAVTAQVLDDKRTRNIFKNACLCIETPSSAEQRHLTGFDACKTLSKVPVLREFTSRNVLPPAKIPVPFLIQHGQPPQHLVYQGATGGAGTLPNLAGGIPASAAIPPRQPTFQQPHPAPYPPEEPRKRGRGRPPLKPRTDHPQFRTLVGSKGPAAAPIPDI